RFLAVSRSVVVLTVRKQFRGYGSVSLHWALVRAHWHAECFLAAGLKGIVKILLYSPDNGVTRNFMPHLWMFLLQALTPSGHEVLLIDGNAQPMNEDGIARFVREQNIGLVGIGAMTRMIAKAYRVADAVRFTGVPVVMGGPHVTEMADEALGRSGGAGHAEAVALGEAGEPWARI